MAEDRQAGLLCGIEFVTGSDSREPAPELAARALARAALGVRATPGGHIIRLAPPFVIDEAVPRDAIGRLDQAISEVCR
jgi:4-aminobutyrate aminotransferase/(S)-3-amino-2-methylpropionate transaminase